MVMDENYFYKDALLETKSLHEEPSKKEQNYFEEPSKEQILKDFPTCLKETLRVVLCIVAQKKIASKFNIFTGKKHRDWYVLSPKVANTEKLRQLKKITTWPCRHIKEEV